VKVTLPAEGAYLSVLRTATAGLAARLDFTLDEIEDLRIAVDEACAMLLAQAIPGTNLECAFDLDSDQMSITVSVVAAEPQMPAKDTFAWTVLSALAGTARARRPGLHRAAQAARCCRSGWAEVRVSSEYEVQVTEETVLAQAEVEIDIPVPVLRESGGSPDRARAREMFERLATLPADDPERARIRGTLVELHLPLVEYLARRFRNRGEWLDDLTQVATIGLIKSIDRFDLERGVEFSTYATPTIVGEIKRHFRDKGWAVRVPRRLQELKLSLTKAISELAQREGRAPTVSELATHLQMTEEEVLEGLESANAYSTVSLDAPDSGDEDAPAVADSLGMIDEALEGVEYRESLKPLLEQLPPREKKILLLRFFGNMTQSQIAAELGISQMHVSRLLARTLAQLREGLTTED
jgi:RNA polymerase sigma-B factor